MNANIMICKDNCVGNLYLNVFCQVPSSSGSRACIKVTVDTRAIPKGKMLTLPSQLKKICPVRAVSVQKIIVIHKRKRDVTVVVFLIKVTVTYECVSIHLKLSL